MAAKATVQIDTLDFLRSLDTDEIIRIVSYSAGILTSRVTLGGLTLSDMHDTRESIVRSFRASAEYVAHDGADDYDSDLTD